MVGAPRTSFMTDDVCSRIALVASSTDLALGFPLQPPLCRTLPKKFSSANESRQECQQYIIYPWKKYETSVHAHIIYVLAPKQLHMTYMYNSSTICESHECMCMYSPTVIGNWRSHAGYAVKAEPAFQLFGGSHRQHLTSFSN